MLTTETMDIDLTKFQDISGRLVPGILLEMKLIEYYTLIQSEEDSVIDKFTNYVLKYHYKDDIDRPYTEITTFFKEKEYVHKVFYFLDMLEIYLLNKTGPDVVNIKFLNYTEDKTKVIGVFEIWRHTKTT